MFVSLGLVTLPLEELCSHLNPYLGAFKKEDFFFPSSLP